MSEVCVQLTSQEQERASVLFDRMDVDKSGRIDMNEICPVHGSDREAMIKLLDVDDNSEVWLVEEGV